MIGREPEAWLAAQATKYVRCTLHIARWLTIMSLVVSMSTSINLVQQLKMVMMLIPHPLNNRFVQILCSKEAHHFPLHHLATV